MVLAVESPVDVGAAAQAVRVRQVGTENTVPTNSATLIIANSLGRQQRLFGPACSAMAATSTTS